MPFWVSWGPRNYMYTLGGDPDSHRERALLGGMPMQTYSRSIFSTLFAAGSCSSDASSSYQYCINLFITYNSAAQVNACIITSVSVENRG